MLQVTKIFIICSIMGYVNGGCLTEKSEKCQFPFEHDGQIHYGCVQGTESWCSIENYPNGTMKTQGNCNVKACRGKLFTLIPRFVKDY